MTEIYLRVHNLPHRYLRKDFHIDMQVTIKAHVQSVIINKVRKFSHVK